MSKPDDIPQDVWDATMEICGDIPYGQGPAVTVCAEQIARAILAAKAEEREAIASYIEGNGGVIPGASVFAPLVSRNNQPCMSGDPRDRLHSHVRCDFDDATASLAAAIRKRGEA